MAATVPRLQEAQTHTRVLFYSEPVGGGIQRISYRIHFHPLETRHFVQTPSMLHQHRWTQSGRFCRGVKVKPLGSGSDNHSVTSQGNYSLRMHHHSTACHRVTSGNENKSFFQLRFWRTWKIGPGDSQLNCGIVKARLSLSYFWEDFGMIPGDGWKLSVVRNSSC